MPIELAGDASVLRAADLVVELVTEGEEGQHGSYRCGRPLGVRFVSRQAWWTESRLCVENALKKPWLDSTKPSHLGDQASRRLS